MPPSILYYSNIISYFPLLKIRKSRVPTSQSLCVSGILTRRPRLLCTYHYYILVFLLNTQIKKKKKLKMSRRINRLNGGGSRQWNKLYLFTFQKKTYFSCNFFPENEFIFYLGREHKNDCTAWWGQWWPKNINNFWDEIESKLMFSCLWTVQYYVYFP